MVPVTTKQKMYPVWVHQSDDSWLISGMESSMVMTRHDYMASLEIGFFQGETAPWAMGLRRVSAQFWTGKW